MVASRCKSIALAVSVGLPPSAFVAATDKCLDVAVTAGYDISGATKTPFISQFDGGAEQKKIADTIKCAAATGYSGTLAVAKCADKTKAYTVTGCVLGDKCLDVAATDGYDISAATKTPFISQFDGGAEQKKISDTIKCDTAKGYSGTPGVAKCADKTKAYTVSGCTKAKEAAKNSTKPKAAASNSTNTTKTAAVKTTDNGAVSNMVSVASVAMVALGLLVQ